MRRVEDLLAEYGDALPAAGRDSTWLARIPEAALTIAPLLMLSRELANLLSPMEPEARFRADLHRALVRSARQQQARRLLSLSMSTTNSTLESVQETLVWAGNALAETDRRWVLGAAAVGSALSLAGVLAYVLRHREHTIAV